MEHAWIVWLVLFVAAYWLVYRGIILRRALVRVEPRDASRVASEDSRVREHVNPQLMEDHDLKSSAIAADVRAGRVTLRGIVGSPAHDQTDAVEGDRRLQREGWPPESRPPERGSRPRSEIATKRQERAGHSPKG